MKLYTFSYEQIEIQLYNVSDSDVAGLEFALYAQKSTTSTGDSNNGVGVIRKTLGNGVELLNGIATVTLNDTDVTESGCYFVEMRMTDASGNKSNLDIRPSKVKFVNSRLGNSGS